MTEIFKPYAKLNY